MQTLTLRIKRHVLVIFYTLTISLTFAATLLPLPGEVIPVVMVFIPALMAIALTALTDGMAGVRALLSKLAQWRISLKWVVIALALAFIIRLAVSLIAIGLGLISTIQLRPGGAAQYVILAVIFFVFAIPEELGWRGYALPKLLAQYSPLVAGLTIGVLWGSLHLALLLPGMMNEGAPSLPTVLALVGGSVLFTWLYVNSGGNIVLTTLFHAAQSFFLILNEGITLEHQSWLLAGVYLATAIIIALISGPNLTAKTVAGVSRAIDSVRSDQPLVRK
ncbi:MAG TPA: type II CAAX endopeptidase family protein [Anaerolineales bacterium]|nr:type II CAAX endopeptidase family protein [Anaerolineales bacterium]